jgi:hypothetical protein
MCSVQRVLTQFIFDGFSLIAAALQLAEGFDRGIIHGGKVTVEIFVEKFLRSYHLRPQQKLSIGHHPIPQAAQRRRGWSTMFLHLFLIFDFGILNHLYEKNITNLLGLFLNHH